MRRITLLTDFGTADGYAAAMKGVIARIAPEALVEDASHEIPPGDLHAAAWAFARYWRLYPPGSIHIVVVDPGVGSARRALAGYADGRFLVAPDNGVLTRVIEDAGAAAFVSIETRAYLRDVVSSTFHGRDVFAPAAAHLARGTQLEELGPAVTDPVRLPLPSPTRDGSGVRGEVVHVDRFGNLVTNLPAEWLGGAASVRVAGRDVGPLRTSYTDVAAGAPLALIGSADLLEISVRDGNAAQVLGVGRGAEVELSPGAGSGSAAGA